MCDALIDHGIARLLLVGDSTMHNIFLALVELVLPPRLDDTPPMILGHQWVSAPGRPSLGTELLRQNLSDALLAKATGERGHAEKGARANGKAIEFSKRAMQEFLGTGFQLRPDHYVHAHRSGDDYYWQPSEAVMPERERQLNSYKVARGVCWGERHEHRSSRGTPEELSKLKLDAEPRSHCNYAVRCGGRLQIHYWLQPNPMDGAADAVVRAAAAAWSRATETVSKAETHPPLPAAALMARPDAFIFSLGTHYLPQMHTARTDPSSAKLLSEPLRMSTFTSDITKIARALTYTPGAEIHGTRTQRTVGRPRGIFVPLPRPNSQSPQQRRLPDLTFMCAAAKMNAIASRVMRQYSIELLDAFQLTEGAEPHAPDGVHYDLPVNVVLASHLLNHLAGTEKLTHRLLGRRNGSGEALNDSPSPISSADRSDPSADQTLRHFMCHAMRLSTDSYGPVTMTVAHDSFSPRSIPSAGAGQVNASPPIPTPYHHQMGRWPTGSLILVSMIASLRCWLRLAPWCRMPRWIPGVGPVERHVRSDAFAYGFVFSSSFTPPLVPN